MTKTPQSYGQLPLTGEPKTMFVRYNTEMSKIEEKIVVNGIDMFHIPVLRLRDKIRQLERDTARVSFSRLEVVNIDGVLVRGQELERVESAEVWLCCFGNIRGVLYVGGPKDMKEEGVIKKAFYSQDESGLQLRVVNEGLMFEMRGIRG